MYYYRHLEIINTFFPIKLTPKEMEVLGAFMNIDNPLAEEDRFNTIFRKRVKKELNLTDGGLSNYMRDFRAKKAVKTNKEGKDYINPILFPSKDFQYYQFKLQKDEK